MRDTPWFVPVGPRPDARLRLICLHHAGGNSGVFRKWVGCLPGAVEIVAIELPGRLRRSFERPCRTATEVIRSLYPQMADLLDLPYVLFGYSVGAILAFELTRMLEERDTPAPRELIVAAAAAPHCPRREPPTAALSDAEFVDQLRCYGGTPAGVLDNEELTALLLPMLRADFSIEETYERKPRSLLRCPLTAYGGNTDPWVSQDEIIAWREATTGPFSHRILHGGHFFMHSELLDSVSEKLCKHLDGGS